MHPTPRLVCLCLAPLVCLLTACSAALRPLDADLVNADPALLRAARSVVVMVTIPEPQDRWLRGATRAKLSSAIVLADDRALTAAHSVVGRRMDSVQPHSRAPRILVGWRTLRARVLDRGSPDTPEGDWAIVELENLREGEGPRDDALPVSGTADPVPGERCVLIGYPAKYLPPDWQQGAPHVRRRTPESSPWRPPTPLVFEGRIARVATPTRPGHRVAIDARGHDLGGLSGGGAFVLRDGVWKLIGPVAVDEQWPWKREIGITPIPPNVRALVSSPQPPTPAR